MKKISLLYHDFVDHFKRWIEKFRKELERQITAHKKIVATVTGQNAKRIGKKKYQKICLSVIEIQALRVTF